MTATLHIFKAGTHTAISGAEIAFSESDLAATAAAYKPEIHEAPLVVGHPRSDGPAYGWVTSLQVRNDGLHAVPDAVEPAFAEMVRARRFSKISAAFYHPAQKGNPVPGVYYLRHVGFLGAMPPAVKGLRSPEFAEDEDCVVLELDVAFSEGDPPAAPLSPVSPPTPQEVTLTEAEIQQLREQAAEAERLRTEVAQLTTRATTAETNLAQRDAEATHAANVAFCERLATDGRLIQAELPVVAALLDHVQAADGIEFGEGSDKKPLVDAMRSFLEGLPKRVGTGEQATRERVAGQQGEVEDEISLAYAESADPERMAQHKKVLAYAKEHKVTYATAARAVIK